MTEKKFLLEMKFTNSAILKCKREIFSVEVFNLVTFGDLRLFLKDKIFNDKEFML